MFLTRLFPLILCSTADEDYTSVDLAELEFSAGINDQTFLIEILEDNVAELVESFQAISLDNIVVTMSGSLVVLTVDERARIIWSDAARIMIDDNDCKCCFKMCSDGCGFAS